MYVHLSSPFLQAVSLHLFYLGRVPFFLVLAGYFLGRNITWNKAFNRAFWLFLGVIHLSGEKVMQAGVKVKYPEPFRAWAPHGGIPDFFARTGFGASLYWLPLWQHRIFIIRILFPWKRTTPNTVSSRQTM